MTYFAIAYMVFIDLVMWLIIRTNTRTGVVPSFPWSIHRDRSPRWFRFNIVGLWVALWICVSVTVVVSFLLLFPVENA
ncbi:MAG: hypothetical protein H0T82_04580 [Sphingomonas sp.]|nr:hypothetical protein [Sphingomonas sp.]